MRKREGEEGESRLKILFLSPVHPLLTPGNPLPKWQMQSSWVRALERVGAEVKVVRYTPENKIRLNWRERLWWNWGVAGEVIENLKRIKDEEKIRKRSFDKIIIYSLGADVLLPQTLRLIRWLAKAPLVILSGVSPVSDGNPREREMAKFVDLAAVNDEGQAREWRKLGVGKTVVLPISAMDPELHWKREDGKKIVKKKKDEEKRGKRRDRDIDVLFVGTLTPERREFLNELKKLLPESVNFVVKEFVWEEEYAQMMSRAKIVLNPIRPEMKNGANLRMFEIPAFGALELASFGKNEWLIPGEEMLVYRDAEEAAELIKRYLKDNEAREKMAKVGEKRVMQEHAFNKRAEKLMEFIKVQPYSGKVGPFQNKVDVSICIVNYKADKELKRCLDSIKKFTKGISFEVIVIDNSSDNRWYSGGNNLALARAKGRYVLFLNPDCYLTENILAELVGWMNKHLEVGASEPGQVYDNREIAPTGSLLPVWWVDAVELTILNRWAPKYASFISWSSSTQPKSATSGFGRTGDFFRAKKSGPSEKYRQVDKNRRENWRTEVVSGAAMMVRKKVLDKIGGFDERLKLYYTDVDLCRRILNAGFEIWHMGEFSLGHSTRKSTGKLKWDELYDVYAQDAWDYYKKWDSHIGAGLLFAVMKVNMFGIYLYRFLVPPEAGRQARNDKERFMKLTAIVLVSQNDEVKAKKAISSVSFTNEVLIVKEKFPILDFSKIRNKALERAKGEWVLFVDSDEVVGNKLREELVKKIKMNEDWEKRGERRCANGYFLKRRDRFLGKWLKYGEAAGVRLLRLAKKDAGRWERPVHEVWKVGGKIGELKNPLLHYSHETIEEMAEKLDRYSEIEAEYRVSRWLARWRKFARSLSPFSAGWRIRDGLGRQLAYFANLPTSLSFPARNFYKLIISIQMIFFPIFKFVWNYFLRLGFLDGMEGLIHAVMMSFHSFLVRGKIINALMR